MLQKLNASLQTLEIWLAAGSLLLLLLLSVFQMLVRNFFDFGYPDIEIVNRHLLVICGMMGAVLATSRVSHIKIDALSTLLSPHTHASLKPLLWIFSSIICLALAYYSIIFVHDEWQYAPPNERWLLPFTLTYPIGFGLMSLHFFLLLFTASQNTDGSVHSI